MFNFYNKRIFTACVLLFYLFLHVQTVFGVAEPILLESPFKESDEALKKGKSSFYANKEADAKYKYDSTGIAIFSGSPDLKYENIISSNSWYIKCSKDQIDDKITCFMLRKSIGIIYEKGKKPRLLIGHNNYPDTEIIIRIDKEQPHKANHLGFTDIESSKIFSEMQSGKEIFTRHSDWPYKAGIDNQISTFGFKQAYEFMFWFADQIK